MSNIFQLVYVSEAVEDISYTDIQNILDVSRANNAKEGITGILIFYEGYFLQLLEGPEDAVRKTLNKILLDERNYELKVLVENNGSERLFANWTMAFYDGDISSNITEDMTSLFKLCFENERKIQRTLIVPMIKKFRSTARQLR